MFDDVIMIHDEKIGWVSGKVVYGYRHHDGCVSFHVEKNCCCGNEGPLQAEGKLLDPPDDTERGKELVNEIGKLAQCGGCGYCVPTIILKSEYDYFAENPEDWITWINVATNKSFNGKRFDPDEITVPEVLA